jgi:predicted aspartyl protease
MKSIHIASLAASIAFCCLLTAGSTPLVCRSEVRFRLISDSSIILVPVIVDGLGPVPFILDTGADDVILDESLARRLALPVSGKRLQATILGAWVPDSSVAKTLQLGPVQIQNAPVLLADLSGVRSRVPEAYGILGQRFLSHFNYLIDYQNRMIRFEQNDEIQSSIQEKPLPSAIGGQHILLLAHAQAAGSAPLRLLLDSGANALVLSQASANAIHLVVSGQKFETTVGGKIALPFGRLRQLALGSRLLLNLPATVTAEQHMPLACDGLLPASLFKVIYINNNKGFIEIVDDTPQFH